MLTGMFDRDSLIKRALETGWPFVAGLMAELRGALSAPGEGAVPRAPYAARPGISGPSHALSHVAGAGGQLDPASAARFGYGPIWTSYGHFTDQPDRPRTAGPGAKARHARHAEALFPAAGAA